MGRYIKIVLVSVLICWACMWSTLIFLIFISEGADALSLGRDFIFGNLILTSVLSIIVFFVWLLIIRTLEMHKRLVLFLWNLTMWIVVTAIFEREFHVISGHVYGLGSYREMWYALLALSTVFTCISYLHANNKLKVNTAHDV